MVEPKLKINQKIDLIVEQGPYQGSYLSKVAEINEDNIKVTSPYLKGELIPLRINLPLHIFITGENAAYAIKSKVIGREREPVALLTLKYPGEVERIQRREFFRMETMRKIRYRLLDADKNPSGDFKESRTCDISGGGVKMIVDKDFPGEGLLELYLDLPGLEDFPIYGEIVNIYNLPDGTAAGIKFVELDHHTREEIIAWLFEYQRKLRQKGLL